MPTIGGRNLGTATGTIRVDTSSAEQAAVSMRRVGQDIKRSLNDAGAEAPGLGGKIGSSMRSASTSVKAFGSDLKSLRGELLAVGAAGALLSKIGLDGAKSIRNYRVSFKNLLGDEQTAVDLMAQLTDQANDFGIEVEEVWQLARALLPTLEGNTDELDEFVKRAALLASTNPLKSTVDASRAIQEYLSGQTISLQRLFNVDPNLIKEAQNQFEGVGDQLDYILTRMGATEEGAREMADAWVGVKNELKLLLAEGFTPLFQTIQPALTRFREFTSALRESNPEIATVGAAIASIAAVGAPTLLFLGQLITTLDKVKKSAAAASLGKAGVLGAALLGGAAIGNTIGRGIGTAIGNEDIANTTGADNLNAVKQLLFLGADLFSQAAIKAGELFLSGSQWFANGVLSMVNSMSGFVRTVGELLPEALGGDKLIQAADSLDAFATNIEKNKAIGDRLLEVAANNRDELLKKLQSFIFPTAAVTPTGTDTGAGTAATTGTAGGFSDEQTAAIVGWWEQIRDLEAQQAESRLDAAEQYEEQRTQLIENYGLLQAREEEDFLRQRRRQNEQFARDVARIAAERMAQEAQWLADLNEQISDLQDDSTERIAEMRQEGNERLAEIEDDYNRQREQAAAQHQTNLLNAASRLDARAIADEQRRFGLQEATAARDFQSRINDEKSALQKRIQQERDNLAERIKQEQDAHEERIAAAREADEERINDMREALDLQQRLEDEDRALRLRRAEEDQQRQLRVLDETNRERLREMDKQSTEELAALNRKFEQELASQGLASERQLAYQRKAQNDALESFQEYWDDINDIIKDQTDVNPLKDQTKGRSKSKASFQSGGVVDYTGLANVHGSKSRPEYVLNADTTAMLRGVMGNFNQASLLSAVSGGSRSTSLTLADGAIQVYAAPGQSAESVAYAVRSELAGMLQGVIG